MPLQAQTIPADRGNVTRALVHGRVGAVILQLVDHGVYIDDAAAQMIDQQFHRQPHQGDMPG